MIVDRVFDCGAVLSREVRENVLAGMKDCEWPEDQANEVIDLAVHAVAECIKVIVAVCERGSTLQVQTQAECMAADYAAQTFEQMQEPIARIMTKLYGISAAQSGDLN